jgi:catechol-2,3-dioxygenase
VIEAFAELTLETRATARLERFYREAFGFELLSRNDDRVWLGVGERAAAGSEALAAPVLRASSGTLDALAERLRKHASVSGPVEHPGGDRSIYVADPEGNVVEVWDFFSRGHGARDGVDALR